MMDAPETSEQYRVAPMLLDVKRTSLLLATWFGCGLSPKAPGTIGSVGAIPVHLVLRLTSPLTHLTVIAALGAVGTWSAGQVAEQLDAEDPQVVVIDEVVGALLGLLMVRRGSALRQLTALGLFRVLDILKPGPVKWAESAQPAGLGIMLDDVVAGLIAGAATRWVR